jgi:hypothetical protein
MWSSEALVYNTGKMQQNDTIFWQKERLNERLTWFNKFRENANEKVTANFLESRGELHDIPWKQ